MNCLDVRRLCLTEPRSHDPRLLLHIYHCPPCRAYRKRALAAELDIKDALAVPVPEGLGRQIVFDHSMDAPRHDSGFRWRALAVTVMLSVVLGVVLHSIGSRPNVVPELAQHMMKDPMHMMPAQADAAERLAMVMRDIGGVWSGTYPPNLTHARLCPVRDKAAAHLVLEGKQGPVTVFLMPSVQARHETGQMQAQVVEVGALKQGSIALFGYEGEELEPFRAMFAEHVSWKETLAKGQGNLHIAWHQ